MKKVYYILFLGFCSLSSAFGQYHSSGNEAESVNIKYYTKGETLKVADEVGGLTESQTEKLYLANLQINRKYFCGSLYKQYLDKNSKTYASYQREKQNVCKQILTHSQYEAYLNKEVLVNNSDNPAVNDLNNTDKRISSTK